MADQVRRTDLKGADETVQILGMRDHLVKNVVRNPIVGPGVPPAIGDDPTTEAQAQATVTRG